ncbi:hypothetical protein [Chryseobacterium luquanense]|uniref:Uncharacterized protein n=1 Tax=Chryseobacterium luquanense TaxID=2983766 RepID=A0ABT3Y5Y8_9FLAO|nr:hypothetical protein [Chryseobacterium luquanense]MCX8533570.1 hypothetical protein [Chryseobacterium luquanense]
MKKLFLASFFTLSAISLSAQYSPTNNFFFKNLYDIEVDNLPSEQEHYHISSKTFSNGFRGLDIKWYGGINLTGTGGDISFASAGGAMRLAPNGNLGIGIDNPTRKLSLQGDIYAVGPAALSFQDDTRFTVTSSDVSTISSSVIMPHYGMMSPSVSGGGELWMAGFKGIRMFTNGEAIPKFYLATNGNASLQGKFEAKEIKVTLTPTADFVFAENYNLPKLEDVEKHIKDKKHLPEIASAKQMEKEGVNVGEFQIKLLQKIEELTLYTIEQNKRIKELESKINKN